MRRWVLISIVPLAVLLCGGVVSAVLVDFERSDTERDRAATAQIAGAAIRERTETTVSRLSTVGGLFAASEHVTEPEFRQFTSTLVREPGIHNVFYVDRVPAAQRAAFERRVGVPIVDGGGRDAPRAPARREYYPYDLTGIPPSEPRVNAPDAAGEPVRAAALHRARDTAEAQITAPVTTFRDRIRALLVFVPVYEDALPPASVAARRATLRGYAMGVLPLSQVIPPSQRTSVTLLDGGRRIAGAHRLDEPTRVPLVLAGRHVELQVATGVGADNTLAVAIFVGGLLLAVMIGIVMVVLARRDAYAQRLVKSRLAEQHKAEAALERSERRHRLLSQNASDWITLVDAQARCTYSSPSVRTVLGREPDDVVGREFTALVHPDDLGAAFETLKAIGRGGDPPMVELRQQHADGHWVPLQITLTVIRDNDTGAVIEVQCASRDVTERHHLEAELRKLAVHDPLTGLANRRGLSDRLESELAIARRYGGGALLLLDLDEFKEVNDTLGHATGDRVLRRVADLLRERTRESDYVVRLGGDEFAVVLPRVDGDGARIAAEGLLEALRKDPELQRLFGRPVTASAGIALMTGDVELSAEQLLINADKAMYGAKSAGRDRAHELRDALGLT